MVLIFMETSNNLLDSSVLETFLLAAIFLKGPQLHKTMHKISIFDQLQQTGTETGMVLRDKLIPGCSLNVDDLIARLKSFLTFT